MSAPTDRRPADHVGRDVARLDGVDKVTGAARYLDDLPIAGMLVGKVLRSPHAHALIRHLDLGRARRVPGVRAVVSGAEFPYHVGIYLEDQTIFATDRARYVGEPVAAVAAVNADAAAEALAAIEVEYEPLPAIFDVHAGLAEGAVLVHPELHTYKHVSAIFPRPHSNVCNHFRIRKGDPDAGFAAATTVVERCFEVPQIQHVPLEVHGAIARQDPGGRIEVFSSAQSPYTVRNLLASCFGLPHGRIRVQVPYVGGAFGCKAGINLEPIAVALAMRGAGQAVKLVVTREEEFYAVVVRQGLSARVRTGVDRHGKLVAGEIEYLWSCGAYGGYGVNIVRAAGYSVAGAYEIPNLRGDSIGVYTNRPIGSAYRGFGMQEIHWALEQHMDEVAHEIGQDAEEFRLRNLLAPGKANATGQILEEADGRPDLCLRKVAQAIGWRDARPRPAAGRAVGRGLAAAVKAPAMPNNASSSAVIKLNEDASIDVHVAGVEIGQGVLTVMAQMAAETLGVPLSKVRVGAEPHTDFSPYDWQTVASRITWSCGNAVVAAARHARQQALATASQALDCSPEALDIRDGVIVERDGERRLPLHKVALGYQYPHGPTIGGPIVGTGCFVPEGLVNLDPDTGQSPRPVGNWTFGAQAAEVEVDLETGELHVGRVAACYDVGRVINTGTIRGQALGGIVQGLGAATIEELVFEEGGGRVRNPSLVDYKVPTATDIPDQMLTDFVETPQADGPFGARGVGEHTMIPTPAAIANAVFDACGVRIRSLPITAEKLRAALRAGQQSECGASVVSESWATAHRAAGERQAVSVRVALCEPKQPGTPQPGTPR